MMNKRLMRLSKSSNRWIALTVLMNWVSILANIAILLMIGSWIDRLLTGPSWLELEGYGLLATVLLLIRFLCNKLATRFSFYASAEVRKNLRERIYQKVLDLGTGYSDAISTSSLVQIAVDGVEALEVYFGRYMPQLFYSLLAPITLFVVLSFISVKSALVLLVCVPLIPISIIAVMRFAKKLLGKYWNIYTNLGDTFLENLQGLTTLKVFGLDEDRNDKMNEEAETFRIITMKVLAMQLNSINIMDLIAFGGSAAGILVGLMSFSKGEITLGGMVVILLLSSEFFIPLRLLGSFFHVAMNGIAASDKIFELLDQEVEPEPELSIQETDRLNCLNLEFKEVTFGYEPSRTVLNDINLRIGYKKRIALVGESGCGKSTITHLLLKLKRVDNGELLFNGMNIHQIPFSKIREKIGYISHNAYIFNGTILDNLKMGNPDTSMETIREALKKVNFLEFVLSLPKQFDTSVGEGGSELSGGQKQRLALARLILSDPEIMIFDEATSNIDIESETEIWKAIDEMAKDKTMIVISHRLANVVKADQIYVLHQGKVVESGTHETLLKNRSKYFELYTHQEQLENFKHTQSIEKSDVSERTVNTYGA